MNGQKSDQIVFCHLQTNTTFGLRSHMGRKKRKKKPEKHTPMMTQYYRIKEQHPDAILFYRLGDFYEMFNDDAKIASEVLGITLTSRNHGEGGKTPLAGVPYHSADQYLTKLLAAGLKVAVCEQIEDPKQAKGVVDRAVVETHTPGTITERLEGQEGESRYIIAFLPGKKNSVAIVCSELTTGEFWTKELDFDALLDELFLIEPKEVVLPENIGEKYVKLIDKLLTRPSISYYPEWNFELEKAEGILNEHFETQTLDGFGELTDLEIQVSGALINYMSELKKRLLSQITAIDIKDRARDLLIDINTARNLELTRTMTGETGRGTLIGTLDFTATPMGKRLIRNWIVRPLIDRNAIDRRLSAVEELIGIGAHLDVLRQVLSEIGDLERLATRLAMEKAAPRDLLVIKEALSKIPAIASVLSGLHSPDIEVIIENLNPHQELQDQIGQTILPTASILIVNGGIIRDGVDDELDELRQIEKSGDNWIRSKEEEVRQKYGISKIKIKYNKVFGYFIEVPKGQSEKVPDEFIRKQTLVNAERFITPELKEMEVKIVNAQERIVEIERDFFLRFRSQIAHFSGSLLVLAQFIARLDVLHSFAFVSRRRRFVRPVFNDRDYIDIEEGRHPVIEDVLGESSYVPNSSYLDGDNRQIIVLTGPNMSGKSTYLRQLALIMVMAQCGCFVPAQRADIAIIDKLFCRVGASDNIVLGRSTFLTEMIEAANILNNATPQSLVLLDEIGRGTSTYDGLSIAWAITEYLHDEPGHRAKTIFATHYHELTALDKMLPRVHNYQVTVRQKDGMIKFMHRIEQGGCDDSYGIYVAKLAGVPMDVLLRAKEILGHLESGESIDADTAKTVAGVKGKRKRIDSVQLDLFEPARHPMVEELRDLDIDNLTPRRALDILYAWRKNWGQQL